jgi:hypothetical protein
MSQPDKVLFRESGDTSNGYITFYSNGQAFQVNFQGIPEGLSDRRAANYHETSIAKRIEPLLVYQNTGFRTVSFNLKFGVLSQSDAYDMLVLAALVRRSVLPSEAGLPMYISLNLGPWFVSHVPTIKDGRVVLDKDEFTEDEGGMTAMVASYTITPSADRLNQPTKGSMSLEEDNPDPQGWSVKCPTSIELNLELKVFSTTVFGTGSFINSGTPPQVGQYGAGTDQDKTSVIPDQKPTPSGTAPTTPEEAAKAEASAKVGNSKTGGTQTPSDSSAPAPSAEDIAKLQAQAMRQPYTGGVAGVESSFASGFGTSTSGVSGPQVTSAGTPATSAPVPTAPSAGSPSTPLSPVQQIYNNQ